MRPLFRWLRSRPVPNGVRSGSLPFELLLLLTDPQLGDPQRLSRDLRGASLIPDTTESSR